MSDDCPLPSVGSWPTLDQSFVLPEVSSPKFDESWNSKKKPLTEEMTGGYLEIMEMNPKFDEGLELLLDVWNEWKSGEMTEPEMIEEAKQDLLAYLSTMLD